jgi:hypothetical protein
MKIHWQLAGATLLALGTAGSAQFAKTVSGVSAVREAITDAQARQLSRVFEHREVAKQVLVNPNAVSAAAGPQPAPVEVNNAQIVPAKPQANAVEPAPKPVTTVEFLKTTAADEALLR